VRCALCIIGEGRCWEKEREKEKEKEKEKEDRLGREEETWCLDIRGGGGVCDDVRAVIWDLFGVGVGMGLGWDCGDWDGIWEVVACAVLCCVVLERFGGLRKLEIDARDMGYRMGGGGRIMSGRWMD